MAYIFNKSDVYALANGLGAAVKEKGGELFFKRCPYCGGGGHDDNTFSVNLESGAFKCFRASCDKHGHFVELARDFNFPLDFGIASKTKKIYRRLEQKQITVRDKAIEYLASRGISADTARKYSVTTRADNSNILVFPFYDENGILISAKYRKTNFDKSKDKNKEWFEKDTKPILFGMMQCSDYNRLVITEGQLDSLSVADCGIDNAVSVPTGASGFTWVEHCYDWVSRFGEIVVFGDYERGKISLVDEISRKFPDKCIKVVRTADYLGEKDANDILRKYGRDAIIRCVEGAEIKPVEAVKRLCDVKKVDLQALEHIRTGIYDVDKVINGLYFGQVALLTGKRGEGKSTLASQIFANALEQGYSVFAYSGELPDYHFKNWIDLQLAGSEHIEVYNNEYGEPAYYITEETSQQLNYWYADKAYIFDNSAIAYELDTDGKLDHQGEEITLLGAIRKAVCRYGIKLVLIDNLMTALEVEPTSDLYRAQSEFIKKVKALAVKLDIAVILIAHPRKEYDGKELDNDSVSGSSDITNAVDLVMTYSANTSEDKQQHQSLIGVTKNRLTGRKLLKDNRVKVTYSSKSKRIVCDNDDPHKIYSCFKTSASVDSTGKLPPF